jgi:cytochrome c biogenesis protein CcmG/thiol:disulfide interchange protein DsbE
MGGFYGLHHKSHPVFFYGIMTGSMERLIIKYWNIGLLIILLLGLGWIRLSSVTGASTIDSQISVAQKGFLAPDLTLEDIAGEEISLSDLRGQVVLVNFWASWCPPCRAEMAAMEVAYNTYKERGFTILAINSTIQDKKSSAIDFVNENGLTFPILFDYDGSVTSAYRIGALPTSFFIDRNGVIQEFIVGGPMSEALLQENIEKLLGE